MYVRGRKEREIQAGRMINADRLTDRQRDKEKERERENKVIKRK